VAIGHDNTIIKFLAPQNTLPVAAESNPSSSSLWAAVQFITGPFSSSSSSVTHTSTSTVISHPAPSCSVTAADVWGLKLAQSIAALGTRIQALEGQMKQCRLQAVRYKVCVVLPAMLSD
jgi:hypothetical protein